jgi:hypothetical protein
MGEYNGALPVLSRTRIPAMTAAAQNIHHEGRSPKLEKSANVDHKPSQKQAFIGRLATDCQNWSNRAAALRRPALRRPVTSKSKLHQSL